jgi:hypothetical protein
MKAISEVYTVTANNAWGNTDTTKRQKFVIGLSDINTVKDNYRGHGHSSYQFTLNDVGRVIEVIGIGSTHSSWYFMEAKQFTSIPRTDNHK